MEENRGPVTPVPRDGEADGAALAPKEMVRDEAGADEEELKAVTDALTRLAIACKSRSLYPPRHPAAVESMDLFHAVLSDSLKIVPGIAVRVEKGGLTFRGIPVGGKSPSLLQLASRLRSHRLQQLEIDPGVERGELEALVEMILMDPEELELEGGAAVFLSVKGAGKVRVVESEAARVEEEEDLEHRPADTAAEAPAAPGDRETEESRRTAELSENPEKIAELLLDLEKEDGRTLKEKEWAAKAYSFLKGLDETVRRRSPSSAEALLRASAEALLFLDASRRNPLLIREILPRLAEESFPRRLLRSLTHQELADTLAYFFPVAPELVSKTKGLLNVLGYSPRQGKKVLALLRNKLLDLGDLPPSLINTLGLPEEEGKRRPPEEEELFSLFGEYQPEELDFLRRLSRFDLGRENLEETPPMLLDLLEYGPELDSFPKIVELLYQIFPDLLESGRLETVHTVLDSLLTLRDSPVPLGEEAGATVHRLLEEATGVDTVRRLVDIAYAGRDQPEVVAGFRSFISRMEERGIRSLVEVLGEEKRMAVRKFICDHLAESGGEYVNILGSYTRDPRWYLVRNMVYILGKLSRPDAFPFIKEAFFHPHPKVRAEAVRALGMNGSYEARELLMQGLSSPDERTRILCIRWLGRLGEGRAASRLIRMLEGKEPGGESLQVKKEIVESLGSMDAPEVYPVLEKYSRYHKVLHKADWEEINRAAKESMRRLALRFPHLARRR
jgi:hypothetical protein